jgi:hypothetical protein
MADETLAIIRALATRQPTDDAAARAILQSIQDHAAAALAAINRGK